MRGVKKLKLSIKKGKVRVPDKDFKAVHVLHPIPKIPKTLPKVL